MQDKIAVITGATSGIGLNIAQHLAKLKATIIINGFIDPSNNIDKISNELLSLGASNVFYHPANLSIPSEIEEMFDKIISNYHKIDILINNAGVQFVAAIDNFPPEKWEEIIRIDLISAFYTIRRAIPIMKAQKYGRIINIASAHGLIASPFKSAYVAAKHGLVGLTKSVALEVAENSITVNAICPGYVDTPLVRKQIANIAQIENIPIDEVINNIILANHANKKFVTPQQIAKTVAFLCSDEADSITGTTISIDGGWTAH